MNTQSTVSEELADNTGADPDVVEKEIEAFAEMVGLDEE